MAKRLMVDYNAERDILYLRTEPLPRYRVREPADGFLIYVARELRGEVVGFEVLDFATYPLEEFKEQLRDYLELPFDVPELGLMNTSLSTILLTVRNRMYPQPATQVPAAKSLSQKRGKKG